jgi:hypothetical protein
MSFGMLDMQMGPSMWATAAICVDTNAKNKHKGKGV